MANLIYKGHRYSQEKNPDTPLQRSAHMPVTSTCVYAREEEVGKKESILKSKGFNVTFTLGKFPPRSLMSMRHLNRWSRVMHIIHNGGVSYYKVAPQEVDASRRSDRNRPRAVAD